MSQAEHVCTAECRYPPAFHNFMEAFSFMADHFGYNWSGQVEQDPDDGDITLLVDGSIHSVIYNNDTDMLEIEIWDAEEEDNEVTDVFCSDHAVACARDFLTDLVAEQIYHLAAGMAGE